jgi:hypothetical protein
LVDEVKTIIREQTLMEKEDFQDISKKVITPEMIIRAKIAENEQKAINPKIEFNKKMPYPTSAVLQDFHKAIRMAELEKVGYIGNKKLSSNQRAKLELDALNNLDWKKYNNPENFELIDELEVVDDDLTKKNPGKTIFIRKRIYMFKGHPQKYILMESKEEAIRRAK